MKDIEVLLEELTEIGAPTFEEERRAQFIETWLEKNADAPVTRDLRGNVCLDLSGGDGNIHLLDAHIDTVFSDPHLAVKKEGPVWKAPGILDNTAACAILMTWAKRNAHRQCPLPFLLSFTVCEEGEGNLAGIQYVAETFGLRLKDAWVFDLSLHRACHSAVGCKRYQVMWQTKGGHSWGNFGDSNAIHECAAWIRRLSAAFPWQHGLHSYNVGEIAGGTGVNVIADRAGIKLDVRSTEMKFLTDFEMWIQNQAQAGNGLIALHCMGDRAAGRLDRHHPMVTTIEKVHGELELPLTFGDFSTNGNALLGRNIPTLITGLAQGGGIHTRDEYLEIASLEIGYEKLCLLTKMLCAQSMRPAEKVLNPL